MRITNATKYDTRPLRLLATRVAAAELDASQRKGLSICFEETYRGITVDGCVGYTSTSRRRIIVYLPKNEARVNAGHVAGTLAHEMAHIRGMSHAQMKGNPRYTWIPNWRDFVKDYIDGIHIAPAVVKPRRKTLEDKLANAVARLRTWETKKRRAETGLKTWKRKVRYYEGRIAAKKAERR